MKKPLLWLLATSLILATTACGTPKTSRSPDEILAEAKQIYELTRRERAISDIQFQVARQDSNYAETLNEAAQQERIEAANLRQVAEQYLTDVKSALQTSQTSESQIKTSLEGIAKKEEDLDRRERKLLKHYGVYRKMRNEVDYRAECLSDNWYVFCATRSSVVESWARNEGATFISLDIKKYEELGVDPEVLSSRIAEFNKQNEGSTLLLRIMSDPSAGTKALKGFWYHPGDNPLKDRSEIIALAYEQKDKE
tara:strand:+ start:2398 stop:3156 length:759 start_codon:yes stop_codon:yes gene_type:complete